MSNRSQDPRPNLQEAKRFIEALTGHPETVMSFRTFDDVKDRKRTNLIRVLQGTIEEHFEELWKLNDEGAGIFVQVNANDGNGIKAENIIALRALFADSDHGAFGVLKLDPSILVESSSNEEHAKQHAYFVLKEGEEVQRFTVAQKALIHHLGTDPSVHDLPRIMRLPGFLHRKDPSSPRCVRILTITPTTYTIDEVLAAYPPAQSKKVERKRNLEPVVHQATSNELMTDLIELINEKPIEDGCRTQAVKDIVVRALGWGMSIDEIQVGLDRYCESSGFDHQKAASLLEWSAKKHAETPFENRPLSKDPPMYEVDEGRIVWNRPVENGVVQVPLCNFSAQIVSEVTLDDGSGEEQKVVRIEGRLSNGKPLRTAEVSTDDFASLGWVTGSWGTRAVIFAGSNKKDNLRAAIQTLSPDVRTEHVYAHLGFRKVGGEWVYLHAGGAITRSGASSEVKVNPGNSQLNQYQLPTPPTGEGLRKAVRASLSLLDVGDRRITIPLLAATYRAPLGECQQVDSAIFVAGRSGSFKSELTALVQGHFGSGFTSRRLPGSWTSTENSLERQSFLAKDTVFTIDDFCPRGTTADIQRLHQKADRVIRALGNGGGRGRMNADGSLRVTNVPRCLILASGEDVPSGHSLRARTLIIEMMEKEVNVAKLSESQEHRNDGLLASALSGYVQWLIPQIDDLKIALPKRTSELRCRAEKDSSHRRTPEVIASLIVGLETFLRFAREKAVISVQEESLILEDAWRVFGELARLQAEQHRTEDPTVRFIELIQASLDTGKAHFVAVKDGARPDNCELLGWKECGDSSYYPQGEPIGWVDGQSLLLEPNVAWTMAVRLAQGQNDPIPVSKNTMWKRLIEKGIAQKGSDDKNLVRKVVAGKRRYVIVIPDRAIVCDAETRDSRVSGGKPFNNMRLSPRFVSPEVQSDEEGRRDGGT